MASTRRLSRSGSGSSDELTGSPQAIFRLFAGGMVFRHAPTPQLNGAQRIARRKAIFGSFTRAIAHTPHRVAVLRGQEGDRVVVQEKPPRSFAVVKKREARRLTAVRLTGAPASNRKPRKGPSASHRANIARREAARIKHEEKTAAGARP